MIASEAIHQFGDRQKRLLRYTYDRAWAAGVGGYEPDNDQGDEPGESREAAEAGLAGIALLALRRAYGYVPPTSPDPVRRAVALAPAFRGVNTMVAQLATLPPASAAREGAAGIASALDVFGQALGAWLDENAWRLDAGVSVAWAGEQNGYGEAADRAGKLLEWQTEDDANVCSDCEALGGMPPTPLADWPCQPGDGATECNVGCRCTLGESDIQVMPGDTYTPPLSDEQQSLVGRLTDARAAALNSMMPDAQYLD